MLYKTMQLLIHSLNRRIIISRPVLSGYESEGFTIKQSGGNFYIKKGNKEVVLEKNTHPASKEAKYFKSMLKEFLDLTFPS